MKKSTSLIANKILVVGPSWVGDMVMAQSLFITLKTLQPACRIDVLAPAWTFSLLSRMPEVTKAIATPFMRGQLGLLDRIKLGQQLRAEGYAQAILLTNTWKSAITPFFANIPVRTGYVGECRWGLLNDVRKLDKTKLGMTVQRFVALAMPKDAPLPPKVPIPVLAVDKTRQNAVLEKFKLFPVHEPSSQAADRGCESQPGHAAGAGTGYRSPADARLNATPSAKILALCPGAEYGPAKRWPVNYYAEIARYKLAEGWQVWLIGSAKEQEITEQINRETNNLCSDFTGRTSLADAVDLLSLATVVISNDSGLMHVASALDKKLVAIFGSSDPEFTPPLNAKAKVVSLRLDCSPCFKRICPLYPVDHKDHTRCLTEIRPDRVLELLNDN